MIAKEGRKKELGCRDPRATVSQVGKKSRTGKKKMSRSSRAGEDRSLDAEERNLRKLRKEENKID